MAPSSIPKLPTFQAKVTHATDWNDLADRRARRFAEALAGKSNAVYVAPGPSDMPFATAFHSLLEQQLVECGIPVQEMATKATILRFDVQAFWYKDPHQKLAVDYASFWTTAALLGGQTRNISSIDTGLGVASGVGPIVDILKAMFDTTNAEVTLTLTSYDGPRLLYRDSETFYVNPTDLPFYWSQLPSFVPQLNPPTPKDVALPVRAGL